MLIRCLQCQYANHVEADATKPRIVCARCATVIPVEFLLNHSVPPLTELFGQGLNQSEPSFMKTPESPLDLDSLFNTPAEAVTDQAVPPVSPLPPSVFSSPLGETPAQVSENRWDSEEILDIPRTSSLSEPNNASPLAIEDLLSLAPSSEEILEPYTEYAGAESAPTVAQELQGTDETGTYESAGSSFGNEAAAQQDYPETVLEGSPATAPPASTRPSVFAQDSYVRNPSNTYVMAAPHHGNKGRLAKIFLAAALVFALLGIGYFALAGLVRDWLGAGRQVASSSPQPAATVAATNTGAPSASQGTAASGNINNKTASPSASVVASASPTAATSAKPSPSPTVTTPTATPGKANSATNQNAVNKPTPTPASATGSSGHSVGTGDGSLAIQLAAYKSSGEAQQTVSRLKSAGVDARVVKADVPGKGIWFRVQAGRFTNETEASRYAGELRAKGLTRDFIVTGYQN